MEQGRILRIGKGADWANYQANGLEPMLRGTETEILRRIADLNRRREKARTPGERAVIRDQMNALRRSMKDNAFNIFTCPGVRLVIGTAFKATTLLCNPSIQAMLASGESPFTTIVIDEAGLMSRAAVSALSLLAARRVLVAGDAKQLAPISKISRSLPTSQATWLASSCLSHLQHVHQVKPGVHFLQKQHRMHPEISKVVSQFQYDGALQDAHTVLNRSGGTIPSLFEGQPRAIWYVLDEDCQDLPSIRAERGPGNRSWIRPCTDDVLAKLFAHTGLFQAKGLYLTPFKAQARHIAKYFANERLEVWSAGTIHAQQGTEEDVIIFDTVNAGSTGWPYDEWKRLVNVGLSRAREFLIVLASRAEMNEPYLRPLLTTLAPRILKRSGRSFAWVEVPASSVFSVAPEIAKDPCRLGNQLAQRKILRPVMSKEQQQLCGREMDGKPRLVRGVAGSGKTLVLAHWLQKTVQKLLDKPDARVWAVFANKALERLIADTVEEAWKVDQPTIPFPWHRVDLKRVDSEILAKLLPEVGLSVSGFDYDQMAEEYLKRKPVEQITPRCQAMFIDEAQDMGPNLIKLLTALVEPIDPENPRSRSVNIFYDNAQNIYQRKTPKWKDVGLDIQGRLSTVMKESFRSTRPIAEFALNVLCRLQPLASTDDDHKELDKLGLIESLQSNGKPWRKVRFNQVDGPAPIFKKYPSLDGQINAVAEQVIRWIREDGVKPGDISILCNDKRFRDQIKDALAPNLREINAEIITAPGKGWDRNERSVVASTLHSFKGYDSEIVVVAGLERFAAQGKILANNLYVAMTRARSILAVYAYASQQPKEQAQRLVTTVEECLNELLSRPKVELENSKLEDFEDM